MLTSFHTNVFTFPSRFHSKGLHHLDSHLDVGSRSHFSHELKRDALEGSGSNHQQCAHILRTNVSRERNGATCQLLSADAQRRKTLVLSINNVCSQLSQCFHESANRTFLHAFTSSEENFEMRSCCKKRSEKSHSRSGSTDVHHFRQRSFFLHCVQSLFDGLCVVGV